MPRITLADLPIDEALDASAQARVRGGLGAVGPEDALPAVQAGFLGLVLTPQHTITSPRDPASGLATGKRTHKPISF